MQNFSELRADLMSHPIQGHDKKSNWVMLELISHIKDNIYVGGLRPGFDLGDFFSTIISLHVFSEPYRVDESTSQFGYTMYDSRIVDERTLDRAVEQVLQSKGNVLIHCQAGINRSNLVATRVLMEKYSMTAQESIELLREKRGSAILSNKTFERFLLNLDKEKQ